MRAMKDSGVKWIEEIPAEWGVVCLKYTGHFENGLTYSPNDITDSSGILVLRSSNIQSGQLNFADCVYVLKVPEALMVKNNDIIICSRNGSADLVGKCAYVDEDIVATFGAFMMRYRATIFKRFAFHVLQAAISYYKSLFITSTINQLTIRTIRQMKVPLPPLNEQARIAAYLDDKCTKIDSIITANERIIAKLKDYKASLITETVTKGLDPDVEMKDSGVEWIGEIPKGWGVSKIKYFGTQSNIKADSNDNYIGLENIESSTGKYVASSEEFQPDGVSIRIYTGDVILGKLRPYLAKCYLVEKSGCASTEFIVIKPTNCNGNYLKYMMLSPKFIDVVNMSTYGTKMPRTNWDFVGNMKAPLPPLDEQARIAAYLDDKCGKIDNNIRLRESLINKLTEYKKSLIYEVVTGKREIIS